MSQLAKTGDTCLELRLRRKVTLNMAYVIERRKQHARIYNFLKEVLHGPQDVRRSLIRQLDEFGLCPLWTRTKGESERNWKLAICGFNNHQDMRRLMRQTNWAHGWKDVLTRLPGAVSEVQCIAGRPGRVLVCRCRKNFCSHPMRKPTNCRWSPANRRRRAASAAVRWRCARFRHMSLCMHATRLACAETETLVCPSLSWSAGPSEINLCTSLRRRLHAQASKAFADAEPRYTNSRKSLQMNTQNPIHQTDAFRDASAANDRAEPTFVAPPSFQHITLNTGHSCSQPREAVAEAVAATLSQVIAEGLANGGWTDLKRAGEASALHVSVSGSTLLAKLYLPCKDPQAAKPAIRIGVSAGASDDTDTWNHLRSQAARIGPGVPFNPPAKPWIGAVFDESCAIAADDIEQFMAYVAMMQWAGDFQRCLAWGFVTWLELRSRRT